MRLLLLLLPVLAAAVKDTFLPPARPPAAVWHRLTRGASGPRRRKRRMRRMTWITETRTRTMRNLLSWYANAPTPNVTRDAFTRRAFGCMLPCEMLSVHRARVCNTSCALRTSEHTTLRGYATQHSTSIQVLRVPATQLILHCHMHREGRVDSSNSEAVDAQPVDVQAVVEPGRRVGVVLRRFSNH